jgi:hypothetical protein
VKVDVTKASGVKCERCWRYTPWNVPGVELCGRCRDVGIEDGWLIYDRETATFSRRHIGTEILEGIRELKGRQP